MKPEKIKKLAFDHNLPIVWKVYDGVMTWDELIKFTECIEALQRDRCIKILQGMHAGIVKSDDWDDGFKVAISHAISAIRNNTGE